MCIRQLDCEDGEGLFQMAGELPQVVLLPLELGQLSHLLCVSCIAAIVTRARSSKFR